MAFAQRLWVVLNRGSLFYGTPLANTLGMNMLCTPMCVPGRQAPQSWDWVIKALLGLLCAGSVADFLFSRL
jgi:hypothetical protein